MTKTCPGCNVLAPHDARYCRHCGALLQRLGAGGDAAATAAGGNVSPIAATAPLSGHNMTDEIVAVPAPHPAAPHTSEVTREEMHDLLGRGTPTGEIRDGGSGRIIDDAQLASTRDGRGVHNSPSAHQARVLPSDAPHSHDPGEYDSEQTQITIPVRPLTSRLPADAAAAALATRVNGKPQFNSAPQQVTLSPTGSLQPAPAAAASSSAAANSSPAQPNEARAMRVWLGMGLAVLSVVVIGCVVAALWFGVRGVGRSTEETPVSAAAGGEAAPLANDPGQLADAKLVEAETLIAAGNSTEALARLREAAVLDPANAEPHRRLARLLLANGSRREAVEELRVVTRLAPADAEAWRSLASAQLAEGLYTDALESYRGLGEASPAAFARDPVQLAYADALRLAGRTAEARAIYRRLETSPDAEVAAASRRQLGQPSPSPTDEDATDAAARTADAARPGGEASRTPPGAPSASPTPQPGSAATADTASAMTTTAAAAAAARSAEDPSATTAARAASGSPSEKYRRGVALWATNRAAAVAEFRAAAERGNSDASYYLGLSIAEGRDPRSLKRAELVAALVHFGRARRGKFRGQSVSYEEQLGRELDRRRDVER